MSPFHLPGKTQLTLNLHPGCVFFLRILKHFIGTSCCFSTSLWGIVINRYYFSDSESQQGKWTVRVYKSWIPTVSLPICIAVFVLFSSAHIDWRQQKFQQAYLSPQYSQPQKINYNHQKHLLDSLPLETHNLLSFSLKRPNIFTGSHKEVSLPRDLSLLNNSTQLSLVVAHYWNCVQCGARRSPEGSRIIIWNTL